MLWGSASSSNFGAPALATPEPTSGTVPVGERTSFNFGVLVKVSVAEASIVEVVSARN
jgi:hypothetical protein